MAKSSVANLQLNVQTSWSGTHGARPAVVVSPTDGFKNQLPVSGNSLAELDPTVTTVVVVSRSEKLFSMLKRQLTAVNVRVIRHTSFGSVLRSHVPIGPGCLVMDSDGLEISEVRGYTLLKDKGWRFPTILFAADPQIRSVVRLMRAGVMDVVLKFRGLRKLRTAINNAIKLSTKQWCALSRGDEIQSRLCQLTARELQIIELVIGGMRNKEIAAELELALVTVKMHRSSLMRKLGARNPAELARLIISLSKTNPNAVVLPDTAGEVFVA